MLLRSEQFPYSVPATADEKILMYQCFRDNCGPDRARGAGNGPVGIEGQPWSKGSPSVPPVSPNPTSCRFIPPAIPRQIQFRFARPTGVVNGPFVVAIARRAVKSLSRFRDCRNTNVPNYGAADPDLEVVDLPRSEANGQAVPSQSDNS
jgi:hypothetical protein